MSIFWRIVGTLGALSFFGGGIDVLTTPNCTSVDFGGTRRSSTYACTFGQTPGDLGAGVAGTLMLVGGLLLLTLLWVGPILRVRRAY